MEVVRDDVGTGAGEECEEEEEEEVICLVSLVVEGRVDTHYQVQNLSLSLPPSLSLSPSPSPRVCVVSAGQWDG